MSVQRPALPDDDHGILTSTMRRYLVELETYTASLEIRAWTVALELRYEAENRNASEFSDLADELTEWLDPASDREEQRV